MVKMIDEEGYRYLGILEKDEILSQKMKEKIMGEYYRRLRSQG